MELWFIYALSAAGLWGLSYAISERVLNASISPATLLFIYCAIATPIYGAIAYRSGALSKNITKLWETPIIFGLLMLVVISYITANFLIFNSMAMKNATIAALVEISYPLFTALFAWVLFKDIQINWGTSFGAVLIITGSLFIYRFAQ